jgi:DNA-directed RNA polymerase specialized sigma24 family protein
VIAGDKNAEKTDNRVQNLEYVTRTQNIEHANRMGLNPFAKLNPGSVIEIRLRSTIGESQRSIASAMGVHLSTVGRVIRRVRWAHVTEGA